MRCPRCQQSIAFAEIIAARDGRGPTGSGSGTPDRGAMGTVTPRAVGRIGIGTIDGGPGPCLIEADHGSVPGLTVMSACSRIRIAWPGGSKTR
jgi:hypothetical protein